MSAGPQAAWLPDGRRLHLHHGPIDLIVDAEGPGRDRAFEQAVARFQFQLFLIIVRARNQADGQPALPDKFCISIPAQQQGLWVSCLDHFSRPVRKSTVQ